MTAKRPTKAELAALAEALGIEDDDGSVEVPYDVLVSVGELPGAPEEDDE